MPIREIAILVAAISLVSGGWFVRGWYEDSKDLAAEKAVKEATGEFRQSEQRIAETLEMKLAEVRTNERVIEKWRTQIVDRPIYHVECIDDDGLSLINGIIPEAGTAEPSH